MHVTRVCVVRARVRMCARAARERERVCDKEGRRRVTS